MRAYVVAFMYVHICVSCSPVFKCVGGGVSVCRCVGV